MEASASVLPWETAVTRSVRKLALTCTAVLSLTSVVWQTKYRDLLYDFVFRPDSIASNSIVARRAFFPMLAVGAVIAAFLCIRVLLRARRAKTLSLHWEALATSCAVLPLLTVPAVEFEHALFTSICTVLFGTAVAWVVYREGPRIRDLPDLSPRQAQILVAVGYAIFAGGMGFLSYWRYLTFRGEVCDTSFEVNAIAGIVRHGFPTISVAAFFYDGKPLPQPYFNNHIPLIYYLYAPIFALFPRPGTVFWLQAAFMGSGTFGGYLIGRKWLESRLGGVLFAWLYLLCPNIQGFCLHDIHANVMTIPLLVLAVGFMATDRIKAACVCAFLTAICREEAPIYAIGLGMYWLFSAEDRRQSRIGIAVVVFSAALQVFFSAYVMPHFGGQPRMDHFNLFFLPERSTGSLVAAILLNPLGALFSSSSDVKLDYAAISLLSMGGLALTGWRAGWLALPALLLLVPAGDPGFFVLGSNYSAPIVPGALLMGFAGIRQLWQQPVAGTLARRLAIGGYVLTTALIANYLYGDIGSKSVKLEYGQSPLRRDNQRNYKDIVAYDDILPPFGPAEKALWDVVAHVPKNVPIATSWVVNPALSHYDVALSLDFSGGNPPPERRARYIVIDKLPMFEIPTEPYVTRFRQDTKTWRVFYENTSGVIFERR